MELKFESDLDFQLAAIRAVADVFKGQDERGASPFSVVAASPATDGGAALPGLEAVGMANALALPEEAILKNVREVQSRNGIVCSDAATVAGRQFSVEMETGTGKTYVYLRTAFELNRLYGWCKFIVVVPSIAIREGVLASVRSMGGHFRALYGNVPFGCFAYDSGDLARVRAFAASNTLEIMVLGIDAINKTEKNVFWRADDRMMGTPGDFVRACRPILILDEPQSIDNTEKAKAALAGLDPLFTLRYSATHRAAHCMLYRLDAVEAFRRRLVKELVVSSLASEGDFNHPYVELRGVSALRGKLTAKLRIDCRTARGGWARKDVTADTVRKADLETLSGGTEKYAGWVVEEIDATPGREGVRFRGRDVPIRPGEALGAGGGTTMDEALVRRQIAATIREHREKVAMLAPKGIKVLTLFFVGSVRDYRAEEDEGSAASGPVARIFEEEWARAAGCPPGDAKAVHDGYFSIDKRGRTVETDEGNATGRENAKRGYELIMRDKTALLSPENPVQFIFSHSALREGWDNPNVFQICALGHIASAMRRRQMIGRGLRICVNADGERVREDAANVLTVFADEPFDDFASRLQTEMEEEEGVRFGVLSAASFADMAVDDGAGGTEPFGAERSAALFGQFVAGGWLGAADAEGRRPMTDEFKRAIDCATLPLPEDMEKHRVPVLALLRRLSANIRPKKKGDEVKVRLRKERFLSEDFKALWEQIRQKTTYRVEFDAAALKRECTEAVRQMPAVEAPRWILTRTRATIDEGGVSARGGGPDAVRNLGSDAAPIPLPDIVSRLQHETKLTRATIVDILVGAERLGDFRKNPETFASLASETIRSTMERFIVDGVKYLRLGQRDVWAQELFEQAEITAFLENTVETPRRGLYDRTLVDSDSVEGVFARQLDAADNVKLFAKLPRWFKIPTPLGSYNPDWAVLVEDGGGRKLYFVVETKGTQDTGALRTAEQGKIKCGKAHFHALRESGSRVLPLLDPPIQTIAQFQSEIVKAGGAVQTWPDEASDLPLVAGGEEPDVRST